MLKTNNIWFCIAFISIFFCSLSFAVKKEIVLSPETRQVRIQAHHAHINLYKLKTSKPKKIKITSNNSNIDIEKDDFLFLISEKKFPSKKLAWKKHKKQMIDIGLPDLPATVLLFSGKVKAKGLNRALSVSLMGKGQVDIKKTKGSLHLFQKHGLLTVSSHKGDIHIQSEDAKIKLEKLHGNIKINSFKNTISVSKSIGKLFIKSFKSTFYIKNWTGLLDFKQETGGVYLKKVIGSVFGYSKEGEIKGAIYPNEVQIETNSSKIHLDFPASQAWLNAETWEGKIYSPIYFYRTKTGGIDRANGKLKGVKKKGKKRQGNIVLKSRSGSIKFYQSH